MASVNDYKLLSIKCLSYFNILQNAIGKPINLGKESNKERFGFYIYMLESICNVKDTLDIVNLITDTEFNTCVYNDKSDDQGVDAIFIDDENNFINLFNFKFRESYSPNKKQSINEALLTVKFTNAIINYDSSHLQGKLKVYADDIIEKLKSKEVWKLRLYVVSNDSVEIDSTNNEIKQLKDLFDLEVIPIGLTKIATYMSIRPEPVDAIMHLEKDAIMPFVESSLSSSKSYILRISANELVRITCNDKELRNNYSLEDSSKLSDVKMDYSLLFDNVRGFIEGSKYNLNMIETLKTEPSKVFMYNNGLTVTAEDIISEDTNANKKVKLKISNFQVVNGGQTLRTIHNFNSMDDDNINKYLSNCELLVRVFKTTANDTLINKIAEFTNSQNAISVIDLKSLSSEQIQIEQFLDEKNIIYARKVGDTGLSNSKIYQHKISMEKFGQVLFSILGFPEKASNQKKQIFDKYYKDIFGEDVFNISMSAEHIRRYFEIKKVYESDPNQYEVLDQKVFYILYMDKFLNSDTKKEIELLEKTMKEFKASNKVPDNRKLIQTSFKEYLSDIMNMQTLTLF